MDKIPQVIHYSTFPYGGAASAAISIHRSLIANGIPSQFQFRRNESDVELDEHFSQVRFTAESRSDGLRQRLSLPKQWARRVEKSRVRKVIQQYQTHLEGNDQQTEVFSQAEEVKRTVPPASFARSIVHLHWTAFGFDWPSFFGSIPSDTPIVWTLHDQNAYTGGCHYTTGCSRFTSGCGNCPQILQSAPEDLSAHTATLKKKLLSGRNLHIVAPSFWMLQQAKRSPILQDALSFSHIPYGLDGRMFDTHDDDEHQQSPTTKKLAYLMSSMKRNLLPTVLLGAEDLSNDRKGIRFAIAAIQKIAERTDGSIRLWTFGKTLPESITSQLPENVLLQQWGYIRDRSFQGRLYRQADVFLMPSLEDNQPQMALESMTNGTPVVAFAVGGVAEVVRDGLSGFCVPVQDVDRMAYRTMQILTNHELRDSLGNAAKKQVATEHDWSRQALAYVDLYRRISRIQKLVASA